MRRRGVALHLAEVKGPVLDRLRQSDLLQQLIGPIFLSTAMACNKLQEGREGGVAEYI
jgi:sulfate permease, SulP family